MGAVTLPTFEALGGVVAGAVTVVVDHVEHVALRPLLRHRVLVVRAEHVQVVVDAHVDVVIATVEPVKKMGEVGASRQLHKPS